MSQCFHAKEFATAEITHPSRDAKDFFGGIVGGVFVEAAQKRARPQLG